MFQLKDFLKIKVNMKILKKLQIQRKPYYL